MKKDDDDLGSTNNPLYNKDKITPKDYEVLIKRTSGDITIDFSRDFDGIDTLEVLVNFMALVDEGERKDLIDLAFKTLNKIENSNSNVGLIH